MFIVSRVKKIYAIKKIIPFTRCISSKYEIVFTKDREINMTLVVENLTPERRKQIFSNSNGYSLSTINDQIYVNGIYLSPNELSKGIINQKSSDKCINYFSSLENDTVMKCVDNKIKMANKMVKNLMSIAEKQIKIAQEQTKSVKLKNNGVFSSNGSNANKRPLTIGFINSSTIPATSSIVDDSYPNLKGRSFSPQFASHKPGCVINMNKVISNLPDALREKIITYNGQSISFSSNSTMITINGVTLTTEQLDVGL